VKHRISYLFPIFHLFLFYIFRWHELLTAEATTTTTWAITTTRKDRITTREVTTTTTESADNGKTGNGTTANGTTKANGPTTVNGPATDPTANIIIEFSQLENSFVYEIKK
jgi:hypothetical protein